MAIALSRNDFHLPSFFNKNKEEEDEFQLPLDDTFRDDVQLKEALNASASVKVRGESSLGFCELCWGRGEYDRLMKSGTCGHYVCLDCIKKHVEENIKKGIKIVSCPVFCCCSVLKFDAFKHLLSEDHMRWEKEESMELIPNSSCSKRISFSEYARRRAKGKYEDATVSNIPKKTSYLPSLAIASSPWKDGQQNVAFDEEKNKPDLAATTGNDDDIDNSDELADTDDYDPDASPRSPETCKKSKWVKKFMKGLEYLSNEGEMDDPNRQWHCPVCKIGNGAGSIRRYHGLHTLIRHAKSKTSNRARLHRELAQLLEQKLQIDKARSAHPAAEEYAKLVGLKVGNKDHEIVWPPMVVIANAFYKQDGTNNAQNSYEWRQHGGTGTLIFESSARGYLEAERLHRHFEEEGIGRSQAIDFILGDASQICGYLALKEDVDFFNLYLSNPKLKYEMRSYQEMVVNGIRQMSKENYEFVLLRKGVAEQQQQAKVLEECNRKLEEKLQIAMKEMDTMRSKIMQQNQQKTEEMESQEQFHKDVIRKILDWLKKEVAEQKQQAKLLEECNSKQKEMLQIAMKEMDTMRSKIMQKTEEMELQGQLCQYLLRKILESRKYKEEQQENVEQCWNEYGEREDQSYAAPLPESPRWEEVFPDDEWIKL